jgi:hypothetical protein
MSVRLRDRAPLTIVLMRHVHAEHGDDWFEIRETYQAARRIIRRKVGG